MLNNLESKLQNVKDHLEEELRSIRVGRAHPSLLDDVKAEVYDSTMPLRELATISAPDPHMLTVSPWDKSIIKQIESAINKQAQGLQASVDGEMIRVSLPPMTEERREEFVKLAGKKTEEAQISLRNVRHEVLDDLKSQKDSIGEDEYERLRKQVEEAVSSAGKELNAIGEKKEKEITSF